MFLEKLSRYVRHYRFNFRGRKLAAPTLPLIAPSGEYSIKDALDSALSSQKALDVKDNGDIVELMQIDDKLVPGALVLLFHRASPDAADPMYRKKARAGKITVRTVDRKPDEDQTVSAHLVIKRRPYSAGEYDAALEEIPGVSMATVGTVIRKALSDYVYEFKDRKGKDDSTYTVFKPRGVKSETVSNAIKTGSFKYITLVRPARAKFVDSDDTFQPIDERMKIRITKDLTPSNWMKKIGDLAKSARDAGWDDFQVDIEMDDDRSKTVRISRGQEAKEIMFLRSELISVSNELPACSASISVELCKKALKVIS